MLARLLQHHILANLTFILVISMGFISYNQLPREQDPSINFNWISIFTPLPGASALDIEKRITEPLEEAIGKIPDIKFISSNSRQGVSSILVRFNDIDKETFNKRVTDLRREIQSKTEELPVEASQPRVMEITSANAFPSAIVLVTGLDSDETLHTQAHSIKQDLERIEGVESANSYGNLDPELQVLFSPDKLVGLGVSPTDISDTVTAYFRDLAAGSVGLGDQKWLIRLTGTDTDPQYLANLPILTAHGEIPLRTVADVVRGREDATRLVQYEGKPAVMLSILKKSDANLLNLVQNVKDYIDARNKLSAQTSIRLVLLDDQTLVIRNALTIMENNAILGLGLVLLVTWAFLGTRIAIFTALGLTFILAGTFWLLAALGQTLNVVVLLGIVISLGMLVDDTIVVAEAIYYRLQRGMDALQASLAALQETFAPVTASVLTTIAAFLPLMLMPGILGKFMLVIPLVVTSALIISLIEAYWMLPTHVITIQQASQQPSRMQRNRKRLTHWIRLRYSFLLVAVLRWPKFSLTLASSLLILSVIMVSSGLVRFEFFASDPFKFFYVNVQMPPGSSLQKTMGTTLKIEHALKQHIRPNEVRAVASYAGLRFTEAEPMVGDQHAQIFISLNPKAKDTRKVDEIIESLRDVVTQIPGPDNVSFLQRSAGPPTAKPISIKVRGRDPAELRQAADQLVSILKEIPAVSDITDDDTKGRMELAVRLNPDAITRAGMNPASVIRTVQLLAGGEVAASMQHQGEKLEVRVRAKPEALEDIDSFLRNTISLPDGGEIPLGQLLYYESKQSKDYIRHYNLRRAITIEADINQKVMDTLTVNQLIATEWERFSPQYPNINLDFSGLMDDIQESIDAIAILFLFGLGLIYTILGTQFKSYIQPLFVLIAVPMAFTGVIAGLLISGNPLSMYTLYGVVALAGISVNAAIVLISTANTKLHTGMSVIHATVYAARRRVIPILITTLTTIAGLFSLATGLGGESLMWGPVATAIVWGLGLSTALTLFVIPLLYSNFTKEKPAGEWNLPIPKPPLSQTSSILDRLNSLFRFQGKSSQEKELQNIGADSELNALYLGGIQHLEENNLLEAIRAFEKTAKTEPTNIIYNLVAAQTLIMLMDKNGWDIGYDARANRYLQQAKRLNANEERVTVLLQTLAKLKEESDES